MSADVIERDQAGVPVPPEMMRVAAKRGLQAFALPKEIGGQLAAVNLAVENGRVTRIYAVANPQKLTRLDQPAELVR